MNGILYYHASIANAYIYQDADGVFWQVPMTPTGWSARKAYRSDHQSLRAMGPNQQRVLASSAGIPEGV